MERIGMERLSGKWKLDLLYRLKDGTVRWGELVHSVPHAAPNVLTRQLKQLEKDGLICRKTVSAQPPQVVEYTLSEQGRTLIPVLEALAAWDYAHRQSPAC